MWREKEWNERTDREQGDPIPTKSHPVREEGSQGRVIDSHFRSVRREWAERGEKERRTFLLSGTYYNNTDSDR